MNECRYELRRQIGNRMSCLFIKIGHGRLYAIVNTIYTTANYNSLPTTNTNISGEKKTEIRGKGFEKYNSKHTPHDFEKYNSKHNPHDLMECKLINHKFIFEIKSLKSAFLTHSFAREVVSCRLAWFSCFFGMYLGLSNISSANINSQNNLRVS